MDLYISQPSSEREAYRSNWQLTQGSPTIQYSENIRLKYSALNETYILHPPPSKAHTVEGRAERY